MSTDPQDRAGASGVSHRSLWFGFVVSTIAWVASGFLDVIVVWACPHQETFGIPYTHPIARLLFGALGAALLLLSVCSGYASYRNWRKLSARRGFHQGFLDAQAVERREYMAMVGVLTTATLAMGLLWIGLPTIFLDLCWRAR